MWVGIPVVGAPRAVAVGVAVGGRGFRGGVAGGLRHIVRAGLGGVEVVSWRCLNKPCT